MVDYWSVVVGCLRSKLKGLNPLQIYNMKQAMSSILTIIFLHIFCKNPQRSQIHRFTCSQGGGRVNREDREDREDRENRENRENRDDRENRENRENRVVIPSPHRPYQAKRPYFSYQAKRYPSSAAPLSLPTLPTPVMLSEAKHLSVGANVERPC